MKTTVIDRIKGRTFEFEGSMGFDDERLTKIKDEVKDDLDTTVWSGNDRTFTLHSKSKDSHGQAIREKREKLFAEKGIPTHVQVECKFYNNTVVVRNSALRRNVTDIGNGEYRTLMIPYDQYEDVKEDLYNDNDCKVIGSTYVWNTNNE